MSGEGGMVVGMWGPPGWRFLHSVAHGFPEDPSDFDQRNGNSLGTTESNYKNFFTLVGTTLPCGLCRQSYVQFIAENPIRTSSRADLTKWLWEIHTRVNDKLGRQYANSDFDSVSQSYEKYRAKCSLSSDAKGCTDPLNGKKKFEHGIEYRLMLVSIMVGFLIIVKRYL